jgi:hypothetical protein
MKVIFNIDGYDVSEREFPDDTQLKVIKMNAEYYAGRENNGGFTIADVTMRFEP